VGESTQAHILGTPTYFLLVLRTIPSHMTCFVTLPTGIILLLSMVLFGL